MKRNPLEVHFAIHCANEKLALRIAQELGIPDKPISPEAERSINQRRIETMRLMGLQQAREGRGDTGLQLWGSEGLKNTKFEQTVTDLLSQGYQLVHAYYRSVPHRDKATGQPTGQMKHVVRIIFSLRPNQPMDNAEAITQKFTHFMSGKIWGTTHIWSNKTESSETINVKQLWREGTPPPTCQLRFFPREENDWVNRDDGPVQVRGNFRIEPSII